MIRAKQIFEEKETARWLFAEAPIWRYVPLRTLFFYLNRSVFVPSIEKLREYEPFEGESCIDSMWFKHAFDHYYGDDARRIEEWIFANRCSPWERHDIEVNKTNSESDLEPLLLRKHYLEFVRKTRFAWCWFSGGHESVAMWNSYANQGVAIQTTIARLSGVLEKTEHEFVYGKMTYVDYHNPISPEFNPQRESDFHLVMRPFFVKRIEYQYEQEVRFVTTAAHHVVNGGILLKDVDPKEWISAIRLWPGINVGEASSIQKAIETVLPGVDCSIPDLRLSPDNSLHQQIATAMEKRENSEWVSGRDGIPTALKRL